MFSLKCSCEHFLIDVPVCGRFFSDYDCHEDALVLEKGSFGVPWADGRGKVGIPAGFGVVA